MTELASSQQPNAPTVPPRLTIALIIYFTAAVAGFLAIVRLLDGSSPLSYVQLALCPLLAFVPLYGYWRFQKRRWTPEPGEYLLWVVIIFACMWSIELAPWLIPVDNAALQRSEFLESLLAMFFTIVIWFAWIDTVATAIMSCVLGFAAYRLRHETAWRLFFLAAFAVALAKSLFFLAMLLNISWIVHPVRESGLYDICRDNWSFIGGLALITLAVLGGVSITLDLIRRTQRHWLHWLGISAIALRVGEIFLLKIIEIAK